MRQVIVIISIFFFASCEKRSHLDFTTDKTAYAAGETVKLNRQSEEGRKLVWIMPGGQKVETFDATYVIDPTMGFGELSFSLKDESDLHLLKRQQTKTVQIYPQSYLQAYDSVYLEARVVPNRIYSIADSANYQIVAEEWGFYGAFTTYYFYFPPGLPPGGSYSIQTTSLTPFPVNSSYPVPANSVYVFVYSRSNHYQQAIPVYFSAGVINVEYNGNIMHINFDNIVNWLGSKSRGSLYLPQ
jgi:hypothetical protein